MSAKEIYSEPGQAGEDERRAGRRFAIILGASILLLFALTVGALYLIFKRKQKQPVQPAASAARDGSQ